MVDVILDGNLINTANPLQVDMAALSSLITGSGMPVVPPTPASLVSAPYVGRVIVAKSGNAVQGGNITSTGGFIIKALPANAGKVYVFGIGQTKGADSFVLSAAEVLLLPVSNLNLLQFDADTASEGVCWSKL